MNRTLDGPTMISPVVTRFFSPPLTPRVMPSPTTVSAQLTSCSICTSNVPLRASVLHYLNFRRTAARGRTALQCASRSINMRIEATMIHIKVSCRTTRCPCKIEPTHLQGQCHIARGVVVTMEASHEVCHLLVRRDT